MWVVSEWVSVCLLAIDGRRHTAAQSVQINHLRKKFNFKIDACRSFSAKRTTEFTICVCVCVSVCLHVMCLQPLTKSCCSLKWLFWLLWPVIDPPITHDSWLTINNYSVRREFFANFLPFEISEPEMSSCPRTWCPCTRCTQHPALQAHTSQILIFICFYCVANEATSWAEARARNAEKSGQNSTLLYGIIYDRMPAIIGHCVRMYCRTVPLSTEQTYADGQHLKHKRIVYDCK